MSNTRFAEQILEQLARQGVREIVLCAGARNAPLVSALSQAEGFKVYSFFDERAAGFFALGRMQAEGRPVAVCTTSGTAVAELLPAVIEADYQSLPLVVVSADRPRAYRGTGAPQTIVQPGLFSAYVEQTFDFEGHIDEIRVGRRPVHLNICFDEPLIDAPALPKRYAIPFSYAPFKKKERRTFSVGFRKPLVIVGGVEAADAEELAPLLASWRRPLYLEGVSQLRGHPALRNFEILSGEPLCKAGDFDGVIRIGSVPTLRYWRDLAKGGKPVLHISRRPWSGLPGRQEVLDWDSLPGLSVDFDPWSESERERDRLKARKLTELLTEFPLSENAWVRRMSEWIPERARVFLGNSLPIREWDLCAQREKSFAIHANRGVNGIDGLISTFLGVAGEDTANWALIGDLSALYDLSAPWALRQRPVKDIHLVVINNGGGKIFERLFGHPLFENRHDLNFADWSKMWNWNYQRLQSQEPVSNASPRLIEIVPDAGQTKAFHEAWEKVKC